MRLPQVNRRKTSGKPGRHARLLLLAACFALGFAMLAAAQDCPGGFCPKIESPGGWSGSGEPGRAGSIANRQTPLADYHRAIVRVGREDLSQPGASYSGTGTFVGRQDARGLVLTAAHVVEQGGGRIWVDFGSGRQTALLLGRDAPLDLAALVVEHPPADVPAIPVAGENEWPRAGETVEVVGFGGGRFRHYAADVRGYTAKELRGKSQLVVAFQPISGDSGGAILYAPAGAGTKKLAGILWGGPCDGPQQPAYETHATCCIYIQRFLQGLGCRPQNTQPQPPTNPNPPATIGPVPVPAEPGVDGSADARLAAIERRLDELAIQLSHIAAGPAGSPGQPGSTGKSGPQGVPGPAGPAGKDADPAALAAIADRVSALEKNLKGKLHFSVQVDSQTGKILSSSSGSP